MSGPGGGAPDAADLVTPAPIKRSSGACSYVADCPIKRQSRALHKKIEPLFQYKADCLQAAWHYII